MSENKLDLHKLGINLPKNTDSGELKKVIKKIAQINNQIVDLIDDDENDSERLKEIKSEIKAKCAKLLDEQKKIKASKKVRVENKLLFLGERNAYQKELKSLGVSMKTEDLAKIAVNAASQKVLLEVEA